MAFNLRFVAAVTILFNFLGLRSGRAFAFALTCHPSLTRAYQPIKDSSPLLAKTTTSFRSPGCLSRLSDSRYKSKVNPNDSFESDDCDVQWKNGSYSWSNPRVKSTEDIYSLQSSCLESQGPASTQLRSTAERYKRIKFDGCGTILLRELPDAFVEPKSNLPINYEDGNDSPFGKLSNERLGGSKRRRIRRARKGRTGVTLWSAAYVVSNYIDAQWSSGGSWNEGCDALRRWTVLELGSGLGLPSCCASKYGMNIVATDTDEEVLKLLEENLIRNKMGKSWRDSTSCQSDSHPVEESQEDKIKDKKQKICVRSLEWVAAADDPDAKYNQPVFSDLESLGGADLILLSDVIYGATQPAWDALLILLNRFRDQRQKNYKSKKEVIDRVRFDGSITPVGDPLVLLGYTQRRRDMSPHDEALFFKKLLLAGMEAVMIPSHRIPKGEKYMLTTLFELRWIQ
ncbi:hypothetical protein ACHAXS_010076 [Conticribra weissflogii]